MSLVKLNRWIPILNILAAVTLVIGLGMNFFYAPTERTMGNVQRIFYFHVGSAWVGAVAFFVALVGGALTLVLAARHMMKRRRDKLAVPYGVAISAAGLWVLGTHYLPLAGAGLSTG